MNGHGIPSTPAYLNGNASAMSRNPPSSSTAPNMTASTFRPPSGAPPVARHSQRPNEIVPDPDRLRHAIMHAPSNQLRAVVASLVTMSPALQRAVYRSLRPDSNFAQSTLQDQSLSKVYRFSRGPSSVRVTPVKQEGGRIDDGLGRHVLDPRQPFRSHQIGPSIPKRENGIAANLAAPQSLRGETNLANPSFLSLSTPQSSSSRQDSGLSRTLSSASTDSSTRSDVRNRHFQQPPTHSFQTPSRAPLIKEEPSYNDARQKTAIKQEPSSAKKSITLPAFINIADSDSEKEGAPSPSNSTARVPAQPAGNGFGDHQSSQPNTGDKRKPKEELLTCKQCNRTYYDSGNRLGELCDYHSGESKHMWN